MDYTFSNKFIEKWRHKYSTAFIKKFQLRVLKSMNDKKPIKRKTLSQYLIKKCRYADDQVSEFFVDVEIELYYPLVM